MGIINAGTAVGAVIAPPGIAAILSVATGDGSFFWRARLALMWSIWWLRDATVRPADGDRLSRSARAVGEPAGVAPVQGLVLAKFLSDAAWYFYISWLPKYLYDVRHFDVKQVGDVRMDPLCGERRGLPGGRMVFELPVDARPFGEMRRGKIALGASAAVMPVIAIVTRVPVEWAIVLFSVAFFGQQSWSTLVMIVPADLFPRSTVGAVAGLVGFGGAMGGVVFNLVVGAMLDAGFGYGPVFAIVSTLHVIAFGVISLLVWPKQKVAAAL